jgi:hypothetical protein
MTTILEKRNLYISHEDYATIMELQARYDEFENSGLFVAEVASRFGLRPFTEYRIIVDRGAGQAERGQ